MQFLPAEPDLVETLRIRFLYDPFAGLYQLTWFDWLILVPYFTCLLILSFYGLSRLLEIYTYRRYRKCIPKEPPRYFDPLPPVTIQLPIYNERYVVERLIDAAVSVEYPRHLLQIQVLDDSTDETQYIARAKVAEYQAQGIPIEYHHRNDRTGFKAGALQEGLKTARGEFIAIFDADFLPPRDFLLRTIHYFTDPQVGLVQTRWEFINRHYSVLTEVQGILLDGHFILEQTGRCGRGLFFNFNGTAGILRRKMIEDAGGWEHDTLTEDTDLSYRAQLKGWKFLYLPWVACWSELPIEVYAFQVQQFRWAKGLTQVAKKLLPKILASPLPWRVKLEAFLHLTPNICYPLMLVVSLLLLPAMIVRFYIGWFQMLVLDLPLMVASFWTVLGFYIYAQMERDPMNWKRSLKYLPALVGIGFTLALVNTRAVLEALFGMQSPFVRTAKYNVTNERKLSLSEVKYRRRSGWLPFVEIAFGGYFAAVIWYAIESWNFLAVPFLIPFALGYLWAGFVTLYQEHQGKVRWEEERRLALEAAGEES